VLPAIFIFHTMRSSLLIIPLIAAFANVSAQTVADEKSPPPIASREAALDNLLAERESTKAFDAAIAAARKSGVNEQAILEALFLFHVDRGEDDAIAALLPEFMKRNEAFKIEDSAIFSVKEDWLAVIEYVHAVVALKKDDKAAFKTHITEAFWLSPRQASAFTPHIERLRLEESMRSVKIDFTTKLAPLTAGEPVALESLISGKKALLFHFWSPASPECEAAMPDFAATAALLRSNDIAVVSLIPDESPQLLADAGATILPLDSKTSGAWLVDAKEKSFGRELRVRNIPTMVLVSTNGNVLFNGDPTDDGFWDALQKIDARIVRPKSGDSTQER
jgi:thiol-disulfide isomerase/thioredoxin